MMQADPLRILAANIPIRAGTSAIANFFAESLKKLVVVFMIPLPPQF